MALISYILTTQPTKAVAGTVPYKNGGQIALRSRSYPRRVPRLNPHTPTNAIASLSVDWELLTNAQRLAWGVYAANSPLTDAWGMPRVVRGYAHYLRSARPRYLASLPVVQDAPSIYGFPPYTLPPIALAADNSTITLTPDTGDDWANEDGAYMLLWISRPTSPARTFAPETYTPLTAIAGDSTTPPGPRTLPLNGLPQTPLRLWVRSAVSRADGRYTSRT